MIEIRNSQFGRGVFAACDIPVGTVVEKSPLITFRRHEEIPKTLENYVFSHNGEMCLCLGVGSLFNHSNDRNVDTMYETKCPSFNNSDNPGVMTFTARRDILKDEQLFISYGDTWWLYPGR